MPQLTLYLLRHAKSSWEPAGIDDFDRPLAKRGRREAADIAQLMASAGYRPARLLCSTAARTRETLAALVPVLPEDAEITLTSEIYEAPAARLLTMIREAGQVASLLLIGHNPGLEQLAAQLVGDGEPEALARLGAKFPPAGFAVIAFATDEWRKVEAGSGWLSAFHTPQG